MDRRDRVTRVQIFGSLLVILAIAVVGALAWFSQTAVGTFVVERYNYRDLPQVWLTPANLPDTSEAKSFGRKFSHLGYEFSVPWSDLDEANITSDAPWIKIPFRSGMKLMFLNVNPTEYRDRYLKGALVREMIRARYGEKALGNDYGAHHLMYATTPRDVTPWNSADTNNAISWLLTVKAGSLPRKTAIYQVKTSDAEGFEIVESWLIYVDLYRGDKIVEFRFIQKPGEPLKISQAEINCVLQSLRYVGVSNGQSHGSQ